ncbi:hypothetical protein Pst134EA_032074 [Puccinia striiformis f. sp. tritici]|uniref:uncharacterized protein n=1 Tax=Puccinia striiformis f. sp. tritici TaxID=168172 RepID=UPI0020079F7F|nr:uncharacterized protein Pst134EA_032074 [Puccinia striiformis f. sp. tritici]KAH9441915.1 hypothetical protein Pst134EA_032074 [Puccinia striiformis f. sp. tritici]
MVANIQKWQSKHQEITSAGTTTTTTTTTTEGEKTHVTIAPEHLVIDEDDFSDYDRLTCVLCQRQFKSPEDLQRHNNLSNLHKTNLQNEKARKIGRAKKAASLARKGNLGLTLSNPNTNSATSNAIEGSNSNSNAESTTKYTDRAAARREAFGQPDAPNADKHEAKKARFEPAPPPALPPAQPDKDGIQATNVGSKMLEKMGWSKGEGLGNGNGRVEPVLASQYIKGVGLGASAGVTVGQYDDSKKDSWILLKIKLSLGLILILILIQNQLDLLSSIFHNSNKKIYNLISIITLFFQNDKKLKPPHPLFFLSK